MASVRDFVKTGAAAKVRTSAAETRSVYVDTLWTKKQRKEEPFFAQRSDLQSRWLALRVPFEHFSGFYSNKGQHEFRTEAPLQLIVSAAGRTRDYSVFGSKLLEVLLQYKWQVFFRTFASESIFFVLRLCFSTIFILYNSMYIDLPLESLFTLMHEGDAVCSFLVIGWCIEALTCLIQMHEIVSEMGEVGILPFVSDVKSLVDVLYNLTQLALNILFCLRDQLPSIMLPGGDRVGRLMNGSITTDKSVWLRDVIDSGGNFVLKEMHADNDREIGIFLSLQAGAMVLLWFRVIFLCRGFLGFGALLHIVFEVTKAVQNFAILTLLICCGFTFAMGLLQQHVQEGEEWHSMAFALYSMMNAGFRFIPPDQHAMRSTWQTFVIYELFMGGVQLLMMNLLIAIMADQLKSLRGQARLMALYARAHLVLEYESRLQHRAASRKRLMAWVEDEGGSFFATRQLIGRISSCFSKPLPAQERISPRWLHVLTPREAPRSQHLEELGYSNPVIETGDAPPARGGGGGGDGGGHQALRSCIESMQAGVQASIQAVAREVAEVRTAQLALAGEVNMLRDGLAAGTEPKRVAPADLDGSGSRGCPPPRQQRTVESKPPTTQRGWWPLGAASARAPSAESARSHAVQAGGGQCSC